MPKRWSLESECSSIVRRTRCLELRGLPRLYAMALEFMEQDSTEGAAASEIYMFHAEIPRKVIEA